MLSFEQELTSSFFNNKEKNIVPINQFKIKTTQTDKDFKDSVQPHH